VTRPVRRQGDTPFHGWHGGCLFSPRENKADIEGQGRNGTEKALKPIQPIKRPADRRQQRPYFRDAKIMALIAETLSPLGFG